MEKEKHDVENAVQVIIDTYTYGDTIKHPHLRTLYGTPAPVFIIPKTIEEVSVAYQLHLRELTSDALQYMNFILQLRKSLREDHMYMLHNTRGVGYKILLPKEQYKYAFLNLVPTMLNAIKKAEDMLVYVNREKLDGEQSVRHDKADAIISSNCDAIRLHLSDIINKCSTLEANEDSRFVRSKMAQVNSIFAKLRGIKPTDSESVQ